MKLEKKHWDWIGTIAIIIMIIACYLLIQERKACEDPLKNILIPYFEDLNITNYSSVSLVVYGNHNQIIPILEVELYKERPKPINQLLINSTE